MKCQRCGREAILFVVAGEREGFERNVGWCESCVRGDSRLELVPYEKSKERFLTTLMSRPAKWYREVRIKEEKFVKELKKTVKP